MVIARIAPIALAAVLLATPVAFARPDDRVEAPRSEDRVEAPRGDDRVEAPRADDIQAPRG